MLLTSRPVAARAACATGALALLLAPVSPAAGLTVARVEFASAASAKLEEYGEAEGATLRDAIVAAVTRASRRCALSPGASVTVTVLELAPSRFTRKQLDDNPSLDVVRSKSLGGAELAGEVRDVQQHLLKSVSYRYFAPTISAGSAARDPWADARRAIDGFAEKLAGVCRELPQQPQPTAG